MTDADVKLLIDTLSAAVAAGQKVSVPAERVLELHARLLVAQMEVGEVERAARAAALREAADYCDSLVADEIATGKVDHNEMAWTQACAIALRARAEGGEHG